MYNEILNSAEADGIWFNEAPCAASIWSLVPIRCHFLVPFSLGWFLWVFKTPGAFAWLFLPLWQWEGCTYTSSLDLILYFPVCCGLANPTSTSYPFFLSSWSSQHALFLNKLELIINIKSLKTWMLLHSVITVDTVVRFRNLLVIQEVMSVNNQFRTQMILIKREFLHEWFNKH